jgi:hypothetical protein
MLPGQTALVAVVGSSRRPSRSSAGGNAVRLLPGNASTCGNVRARSDRGAGGRPACLSAGHSRSSPRRGACLLPNVGVCEGATRGAARPVLPDRWSICVRRAPTRAHCGRHQVVWVLTLGGDGRGLVAARSCRSPRHVQAGLASVSSIYIRKSRGMRTGLPPRYRHPGNKSRIYAYQSECLQSLICILSAWK